VFVGGGSMKMDAEVDLKNDMVLQINNLCNFY
jgi:hypothetical protein